MAGIDFDFSDVLKLAAAIEEAPQEARKNIRKAVEVTARHVKDDAAKTAKRSGLGRYAASIDYDILSDWAQNRGGGNNSIGAEIGPNLGKKMGSFGFVEDAEGGVRSAPQHALKKAVRKNEADFIKGIEMAVGKIL